MQPQDEMKMTYLKLCLSVAILCLYAPMHCYWKKELREAKAKNDLNAELAVISTARLSSLEQKQNEIEKEYQETLVEAFDKGCEQGMFYTVFEVEKATHLSLTTDVLSNILANAQSQNPLRKHFTVRLKFPIPFTNGTTNLITK